MFINIGYALAFSLSELENIDWTKLIIIATVASFLIACVVAFIKVKNEFMAEEDADNGKSKNKRRKK